MASAMHSYDVSATVSGVAAPGRTLTANVTSSDPNYVYAYRWQSSADGSFDDAVDIGANAPTYVVAPADAGSEIRVIVTAVDTVANQTNSVTSAPTSAVHPQVDWINTNGGDWSVAANWSGGRVPGASDVAAITTPGNYMVMASGQSAYAVEVGADAGLWLTGTFQLGAVGAVSSNQGTIEGVPGVELHAQGELDNGGQIYLSGWSGTPTPGRPSPSPA